MYIKEKRVPSRTSNVGSGHNEIGFALEKLRCDSADPVLHSRNGEAVDVVESRVLGVGTRGRAVGRAGLELAALVTDGLRSSLEGAYPRT